MTEKVRGFLDLFCLRTIFFGSGRNFRWRDVSAKKGRNPFFFGAKSMSQSEGRKFTHNKMTMREEYTCVLSLSLSLSLTLSLYLSSMGTHSLTRTRALSLTLWLTLSLSLTHSRSPICTYVYLVLTHCEKMTHGNFFRLIEFSEPLKKFFKVQSWSSKSDLIRNSCWS